MYIYLAHYTLTTTSPEHINIKLIWRGTISHFKHFYGEGKYMFEYLYPVRLFQFSTI
jgi:hypothetical protein